MTERIRITRIELGETQTGKAVAHLFTPGAQFAKYPVLTLFNPGLLVGVGIDPNSLTEGKPIYCSLWAHYEISEKMNGRGNPYKNIVSLERIDAPATTTSTDNTAVLAELRAIKALLLELAAGSTPPAAEQAERIHALNQAGRTGPLETPAPAWKPPEPGPELTEAQARTEFYELTGPAVIAGTDPGKINDLTSLANGDGWNKALAGLKELLAK